MHRKGTPTATYSGFTLSIKMFAVTKCCRPRHKSPAAYCLDLQGKRTGLDRHRRCGNLGSIRTILAHGMTSASTTGSLPCACVQKKLWKCSRKDWVHTLLTHQQELTTRQAHSRHLVLFSSFCCPGIWTSMLRSTKSSVRNDIDKTLRIRVC